MVKMSKWLVSLTKANTCVGRVCRLDATKKLLNKGMVKSNLRGTHNEKNLAES